MIIRSSFLHSLGSQSFAGIFATIFRKFVSIIHGDSIDLGYRRLGHKKQWEKEEGYKRVKSSENNLTLTLTISEKNSGKIIFTSRGEKRKLYQPPKISYTLTLTHTPFIEMNLY